MNLRDLGGHRAADGRYVKTGCLYRSDELCALTDTDVETIGAMGIKVVFDLRNDLAPELRIIVDRAVEAHRRPLLFHCAAGKDRTGVAAAVLLGLLGVADETILDEYEQTSIQSTPRRLDALRPLLAEHGIDEERIRPLLQARRPVLARALAHLHDEWGSFEDYAVRVVGVTPDVPTRLRHRLLTASS
jgi:protein-tyrosine phosphatase